MKARKRGSKKVKASPMAVNLGACLRFYAPNEKTHVDAMRKAESEKNTLLLALNVEKC